LLYASLLFQQSVPPVMAFHLGSLGFLTPFQFHNFHDQVTNVLEGHAALTLRSRLRCIIVRKNQKEGRKDVIGQNGQVETSAVKTLPSANILVLNEVVIDRGPSPYLSNIDLFLDGKYITSVQGDGEQTPHRCCLYLPQSTVSISLHFKVSLYQHRLVRLRMR
jgi:NAD+ kinase